MGGPPPPPITPLIDSWAIPTGDNIRVTRVFCQNKAMCRFSV